MDTLRTLFKDEFLFQLLANHWVMTLVLVGLVALFVHVNKKLNATTRHNVWLITLVSFLLMPLLIFAPRPDVTVPKIDSSLFQISDNASREVVVNSKQGINSSNEADVKATEFILETNETTQNQGQETALNQTNSAATVSDTQVNTSASISLAMLLKTLFLIWITGVLVLIRRLWLEYRAARELELQSDSVTPYFQRRFEQLCARLEVDEIPPLRFHAGINAPMTVGLYRVWVAIPMVWREHIDDDIFDQTLTHEMGHIARKDPMVNTLQRFLEIALWMYPAVWYVSRQLELERESACDDWVLTHDGKGSQYASNLLDVAESLYLQPKVLAVGCLRSHSQLSRRIQNLLDKTSDHAISNSGKLISAVAAGLLVTLSASAVIWPDANAYLAKQNMQENKFNAAEFKHAESKIESHTVSTSNNFLESIKNRAANKNNIGNDIAKDYAKGYSINPNSDPSNTTDGEVAGIEVNGKEVEFPPGGGTVVINGVEITQTPEGSNQIGFGSSTAPTPPASPTPPVTHGTHVHPSQPDLVMNTGAGNYQVSNYSDNDTSGYSITTSDGKYGTGSVNIKRKNGRVEEINLKPKINKRKMPLLHAAWEGDWLGMKRLIKEGRDVNAVYPRPTMPRTALNAAILQGNLDMVEYLVENGADIKADYAKRDTEEVTNALLTAVLVSNKDIVKYLRKQGAYPKRSTLLMAVQSKDTSMVEYLLDSSVEMDESALVVAVQNRDYAMVEMLLDRNDCKCLDEDSALILAVQNRDTQIVKLLLQEGADADDGALMMAVQNRDSDMANLLLDAGANPDDGALIMAVQNRDKILAKKLLKAGADADEGALVIAIQNRDLEMVDWLLDAGVEPDDGAVVMAVQNGNKDLVRRLVKAGADIDDGALIMAIQNRDQDMVKFLIEAGAEVEDGAMFIAIQSRNEEMINLIRKYYTGDDSEYERFSDTDIDREKLKQIQAGIELGSQGLGKTIETLGGAASGVLGIIGDAANLEQYEYQGLALLKALEQENTVLAKELMQEGMQPNTLHLLKALEQEEVGLAKEMLARGAKPDSLSVLKALEMNDLSLARSFIDKGAQPNGLILLKAIEIGDEDFIDLVRSKAISNGFKSLNYSGANNMKSHEHSHKSSGHQSKNEIRVDGLLICSSKPPSTENCKLGEVEGIFNTTFSYSKWPVDSNKITMPFGKNAGKFKNKNYVPHTGVDIAAELGAEIRAIESGTVIKAKYLEGFGNVVMIDHGNGFVSEYASNDKNLVVRGQKVNKGQRIATVGRSANNATAPHLHFELNYLNQEVNPEMFYKKNRVQEVIAGL